jgi:hypothetical protein
MKVFDLQCSQGHCFEGWFGSEADFVDQQARALVDCPLCGDGHVQKMLSAPRLNLGRAKAQEMQDTQGDDAPAHGTASTNHVALAAPQTEATQALLHLARELLARTQDVGKRFAEEARKIHYGEAQARPIRGQATPQQTRDLLEEGVQVMPFVLPESLKGPLQ